MRRDVVHHRTKKVVTKELVLFNRYLFVAQPAAGADWFRLRRCDGVEAVLGSGGRYLPVDARAVEAFRRAEAELEFDETRAARLRRKEIGRTRKATAAMQFPAGAASASGRILRTPIRSAASSARSKASGARASSPR